MFHKGQTYSIDLVFAISIITILLLTVVYYQNFLIINVDEHEKSIDMDNIAANAAAQLVITPGDPSNWSDFDVSSIGLAKEPNVLDQGKVSSFFNLINEGGYEKGKELLGVINENSKLEYLITLEGGNSSYTAGKQPNGKSIATSSRYALLNNEVIKLTVMVWEKT